jgi:2-hydroxychromene-2-carboxylate isomerase
MKRQKPPRHYFCFRSPFSWMAFHYLRAQLSEAEWSSVELVPFWEPDETTMAGLRARGGRFLYHTMSREKHLYILQDVKRLAADLGLSHVWPIDEKPWWELPNLVYFAAAERGRGLAFVEAVFKARWEDGIDIHRPEALERICAELGLDPALAREASGQEQVREKAVATALRWEKDGLFGVPFFVVGFQKFWGVDRAGAFVQALRGEPITFFVKSGGAVPAGRRESAALEAVETLPPEQIKAVWDDRSSPVWRGIPAQLAGKVGALDTDSAGGCG